MLNFIGMIITKGMLVFKISNVILKLFSILLVKQLIFYLGVLVAKHGIFDKWIKKLEISKVTAFIVISIVTALLIFKIDLPVVDEYIYMILAIIFIFMLVILINENNKLVIISKHTTNIWLTHSFFCYYLFQRITFYPKYSILIFIWNIILSLISSIIINYILKLIHRK